MLRRRMKVSQLISSIVDELIETLQDLQAEKNHEEDTYCANSLPTVIDNAHKTVMSKLS